MAFMRNKTHFWNNIRHLILTLLEQRAEFLQMAQCKAPSGNARSLGEIYPSSWTSKLIATWWFIKGSNWQLSFLTRTVAQIHVGGNCSQSSRVWITPRRLVHWVWRQFWVWMHTFGYQEESIHMLLLLLHFEKDLGLRTRFSHQCLMSFW